MGPRKSITPTVDVRWASSEVSTRSPPTSSSPESMSRVTGPSCISRSGLKNHRPFTWAGPTIRNSSTQNLPHRRLGVLEVHHDVGVLRVRGGRSGRSDRLHGRIVVALDRRERARARSRRVAELAAQAERHPLGADAGRVERPPEEREEIDGDVRVLHVEPPLDVRVLAAQAVATDARGPGPERVRALVLQHHLLGQSVRDPPQPEAQEQVPEDQVRDLEHQERRAEPAQAPSDAGRSSPFSAHGSRSSACGCRARTYLALGARRAVWASRAVAPRTSTARASVAR